MISVIALEGLAGQPLVYEATRTLSERAVGDDFKLVTDAPLLVTGVDPGGSYIKSLVGGTLVYRGSQVRVGLEIPLKTQYGGTGALGPWTPGSVFFVGSTGNFAQDNANLFWNDTTNQLGIGTAPSARLHVAGDATTGDAVLIIGADRGWYLTQGGTHGSAGSFAIRDNFANANRILIDGSGNVGIGASPSAGKVDVRGGDVACDGAFIPYAAGLSAFPGADANKTWIYRTGSGGGAWPFTEAGHLVLQSRQSDTRSILFATGATASVKATCDGVGNFHLKALDKGGAVYNVMHRDFGAVGDGSTDDTAAINSAITAAEASATPGTVLLPAGHSFKTTGGHTITTCSVIGGGSGQTVIKLEHATNDLFTISSSATRSDLVIGGFKVTSSTTRTAGWVIKYAPTYNAGFLIQRSRFFDITMLAQFHGIWIARYEYVWLDNCLYDYPSTTGTTGAIGFKLGQTAATNVSQGVEIYLTNCQSNNRTQASNSYGFWIEDCDAVYMKGCGALAKLNSIYVTNTGHGCANFFWDQAVADQTSNSAATNHSCYIRGANANERWRITNSWFSSAGTQGGAASAADGMHIDAGAAYGWVITNSHFLASGRYGWYGKDFLGELVGNYFEANGTAGFYVDATAAGNFAGYYVGNFSIGAVPWQTAATSARAGFHGNFYTGAAVYGVAPAVNTNNVTY